MVYRADGKDVDSSDLPKLLATSRCVLVSTDGQKVDPMHLQIVKPDTLLVVVPTPAPIGLMYGAPAPAGIGTALQPPFSDPYAVSPDKAPPRPAPLPPR